MISALWLILTVLLATFYYGVILVVAALLGVRYRPGGVYDTVPRAYGRFILRANGLKVSVRNSERLEGVQPCVYIGNHESWVDPFALVDVLPGSVRFTPKKELVRVPLFGHALRAGKHLAIDRENRESALEAYREAADMMHEGISAIVFPEGTRNRDGELLPFKKGPFVLAILAQVPIVPLWLEGPREALPPGSLRLRRHPIEVRVGQELPTVGLTYEDRDNLSARCREAMLGLRGKGERGKGKGEGGKGRE